MRILNLLSNIKIKVVLLLTILCVLFCATLQGVQGKETSEYDVKAAFLYNFTKFVDWPGEFLENQDSLQICIFGENPFGKKLDAIVSGKTVYEKPIKIIYTTELSNVKDCQILYIIDKTKEKIKSITDAVLDLPILTVSDFPGFVSQGGMIGFYLENNKVRFEISPTTVHNSGMDISSRLLKIARIVQVENQR